IEGLAAVDQTTAQVLAHDPFVRLGAERQGVEQLTQLRAPDEGLSVGAVVKRADPQRVSGAEESAAPAVPDRECEITDDSDGATLAPEGIGLQHELRVGVRPKMDTRGSQRCGELRAVVDPSVENKAQCSALVEQRLLLGKRLRRRARDAMPKADRPVCPAALAVRAAVSDRLDQSLEKPDVGRAIIETIHAGETAHGARSRSAMVAGAGSQAGMRTSTASRAGPGSATTMAAPASSTQACPSSGPWVFETPMTSSAGSPRRLRSEKTTSAFARHVGLGRQKRPAISTSQAVRATSRGSPSPRRRLAAASASPSAIMRRSPTSLRPTFTAGR